MKAFGVPVFQCCSGFLLGSVRDSKIHSTPIDSSQWRIFYLPTQKSISMTKKRTRPEQRHIINIDAGGNFKLCVKKRNSS